MLKQITALTALISCSLFAQDLVQNGKFDKNYNDAGFVPQMWQDASKSYLQIGNDGVDDTNAILHDTAKNAKGSMKQTIDCKGKTVYVLSAFFKYNGCNPVIKVLDAKGNQIALLKAPGNENEVWNEYSVKFRTPAKNTKITVVVTAEGEKGYAKVDNISIMTPKDRKAAKKVGKVNFAPPADAVNLALKRPYTMSVMPLYSLTKDDGDKVQLTDGKFTKGHFWTQKSSLGWTKQTDIKVTVDLGKVQPIKGFMFSGVADTTPDSPFPYQINIFTSLDNKSWYYTGELIANSYKEFGKPGAVRKLYRAASMNMPTKGRYVCFQMKLIPTKRHLFADELMIFKGDDALLAKEPAGIKADSLVEIFNSFQLADHFRQDADYIISNAANVPAAQKQKLIAAADEILKNPAVFKRPADKDFIPMLPLHKEQEKIFALNNIVLKANGYTQPMFWQNNRWENLHPVALPPKGSTPAAVKVDMMAGEVRSESINLLNPTDKVLEYKVSVEGMPASAKLNCREVLFMDTKQLQYVADALKDGQGSSVTVKIYPGMSRQIWFTFVKPDLKPGVYKATVKATAENAPTVTIPLELAISTVKFPARPRMHIGGWEYLGHGAWYGNRGSFNSNRKFLDTIYLDSPAAKRSMFPTGAKYDKTGKLLNPDKLNTTRFDNWIKLYPDARYFTMGPGSRGKPYWGPFKFGTKEFERAFTEYLQAFAKHIRKKGLKPSQIVFHCVDETRNHEYDRVLIGWAKIIKKAVPEFRTYANPIYGDPTKALPELFEVCDIICPNLQYTACNKKAWDFYRNLGKKGKELWWYSCGGPSRLLDPVYYYRAQAWQSFDIGGCGSFFWAFGSASGQTWYPYVQKSFDYSPYYVSATDVMAAKQSEGIMEGVLDYEYLAMLKDRVAELKKAGKKSKDIDAAEKLLVSGPKRVRDAYIKDSYRFKQLSQSVKFTSKNDRSVPDKVRLEVLRMLEKLQ